MQVTAGSPSSAANLPYSASMPRTPPGVVDEVHLVDDQHDVADAEQRDEEAVTAGLGEHALARVDEDDARSAVDAPVTMLRVYCSCPGLSATMKFGAPSRRSGRRRRAQSPVLRVGVGLGIGRLAAGERPGMVEQAVDQGALALALGAARAEAEQARFPRRASSHGLVAIGANKLGRPARIKQHGVRCARMAGNGRGKKAKKGGCWRKARRGQKINRS